MPITCRSSRKTSGFVVVCILLLAALSVTGCQSQEAPIEKKETATQPIAPTPSGATSTSALPTTSEAAPEANTPAVAPHLDPSPANSPITIEPMVVFEEPYPSAPEEKPPTPEPASPGKDVATLGIGKHRPRVAIIIDDMGHHQRLGEKLLALDLNLTFSFLPDAPFAVEQAEAAVHKGREVLVHLPMEPKDPRWHPGDGALYVKDSPDALRRKTLAMLAAVPLAVGANNHMGSRLTEDGEAMGVVLQTLKERSLFFIDSYTSACSKGLATAEQLGVPAARREVFLDNVQEPRQICRRLEELATVAKQRGWAIGIGHPYPATLQALDECDEQLLRTVDLVRAGQLVQ